MPEPRLLDYRFAPRGGVAERLIAAVLKTAKGGNVLRGFKSLPLRHLPAGPKSDFLCMRLAILACRFEAGL